MVDNKVDGNNRLYAQYVTTVSGDGGAHRSEVDKKRDACKILKQHTSDDKRYLSCPIGIRLPMRQSFDIFLADVLTIEVAEDRFEENAKTYW